MKKNNTLGFTLMEIMIVIAIIGILIAIAIPSYKTYTRRAHYTEIVQATAPYKIGVEECYQLLGNLENCISGQNGVPASHKDASGKELIDTISVEDEGIITVIPQSHYGIENTDTYILTPTIINEHLNWQSSGGGVEKGYAR